MSSDKLLYVPRAAAPELVSALDQETLDGLDLEVSRLEPKQRTLLVETIRSELATDLKLLRGRLKEAQCRLKEAQLALLRRDERMKKIPYRAGVAAHLEQAPEEAILESRPSSSGLYDLSEILCERRRLALHEKVLEAEVATSLDHIRDLKGKVKLVAAKRRKLESAVRLVDLSTPRVASAPPSQTPSPPSAPRGRTSRWSRSPRRSFASV